ncbi:hypothetical protein PCASD_06577 [Puccinia coronata f. sp. avenae]|uniref:Uncharacterized protein n=1 Tax=Puccinia coronata f. sp. avenae TaxID=200324 RepID=A0A2N5UTK9_9BASI|nr:hypothetical protein PCASD_23253 [Puccinia coronata f. sp. avenae]PLW40976.1 hypothetical protein PCASD_06577 [Puccinia coronata f. sp. avenae]
MSMDRSRECDVPQTSSLAARDVRTRKPSCASACRKKLKNAKSKLLNLNNSHEASESHQPPNRAHQSLAGGARGPCQRDFEKFDSNRQVKGDQGRHAELLLT